jgi:hypothetical protein
MKSVLFIHGDKGGVGKTQCATRTAAAFEAAGRPLTLIDGDVKNPGLDMLFEDRTTCVDLRTAAGIEEMLEIIVSSPHDVLIDLPAGGSDATAKMTSGGSAEGMIDLAFLLDQIDARAVMLFVIDQSREVLAALRDEMAAFANHKLDWVVVRNHFHDRPFSRFDQSQTKQTLMDIGGQLVEMTRLDPAVVAFMADTGCNLNTIHGHPDASLIPKMRASSALRTWTEELAKVGLLRMEYDHA